MDGYKTVFKLHGYVAPQNDEWHSWYVIATTSTLCSCTKVATQTSDVVNLLILILLMFALLMCILIEWKFFWNKKSRLRGRSAWSRSWNCTDGDEIMLAVDGCRSLPSVIYTVSQKGCHFSFCNNFGKCRPILIILSLLYSQFYCWGRLY